MQSKKLFCHSVPILVLVVTAFFTGGACAAASENQDYVTLSLVEIAARFYGNQRWARSNMISITPYYALDGSINAYAAQFAKEGSGLLTEADLAERVSAAEGLEKFLRENPPRQIPMEKQEETAGLYPPDFDGTEPTFTILEGPANGRAGAKATLVPGAFKQNPEQLEQRLDYQNALTQWRQDVKAAANAAVLANDIGTVIIAARNDLYPLLERFDGVAPHIKFESRVRTLVRIPGNQAKAIQRSFYLGPMAVFHEALPAAELKSQGLRELIDPLKRRVLKLTTAAFAVGKGILDPAPEGKLTAGPQAFWDSIRVQGTPPTTGGEDQAGGASHTIPGVPYYHQNDYGIDSCGPTASAQVLGYWDDNGYGNLVDNGSSTTGHENELIYSLMRSEDYSPTAGTYGNKIEPGIEAVCNNNEYGNNLNFNVISEYAVSWSADIVAEINAQRPFVFFNWNTSLYPFWAHFTTGTGYNDNSGHLLYVHYNYPPDTPYELNWDNISSSNQAIYKVNPNATPTFDCLWSEDFEGSFPGVWAVGSNGATTGFWDEVSYRSHNVTTNPSPPGGNTSYAGYCVDSHVSPPGPYPNNVNGWMDYGPFSTVGRTAGEINAYIWRYILDGGAEDDYVGLFASLNGTNYYGTVYWGDYPSWSRRVLDFSDVYHLGNILNQPQVWVAVWFHSDAGSTSEGAYVDDITIRLEGLGMTPLANETPVTFADIPHNFTFEVKSYDWCGVAINPTTDHDIKTDDNPDFGSTYRSSAYPGTARDFVVTNGHDWGSVTHYAQIYHGTSSNYTIEAEWEAFDLSVGSPASVSLSSNEIIEMYEINLTQGQNYNLTVAISSGSGDVAVFVFRPTRNSGTRNSWDWKADQSGAGGDESLSFTADTSGYYGIAVLNENGQSAGYTITIDVESIVDLPTLAAEFGRLDCLGDCVCDFIDDGDVDGLDLYEFIVDYF